MKTKSTALFIQRAAYRSTLNRSTVFSTDINCPAAWPDLLVEVDQGGQRRRVYQRCAASADSAEYVSADQYFVKVKRDS